MNYHLLVLYAIIRENKVCLATPTASLSTLYNTYLYRAPCPRYIVNHLMRIYTARPIALYHLMQSSNIFRSSSDKNLVRIYTARPNRAAFNARIFSGKTYGCLP